MVEAKRWDLPHTEGLAQAKSYSDKLRVRFTYASTALHLRCGYAERCGGRGWRQSFLAHRTDATARGQSRARRIRGQGKSNSEIARWQGAQHSTYFGDYFLGADSKPVSAAEFLTLLFGELPEFFRDEDDLRALWSLPDTRKKQFEGLAEKGFGKDQLGEMQKIIDAENSDLCCSLRCI